MNVYLPIEVTWYIYSEVIKIAYVLEQDVIHYIIVIIFNDSGNF